MLLMDDHFISSEPEKIAATLGTRVVALALGSTGDTFSLAVAEAASGSANGATLIRHRVHSFGEQVVDVGETLPEEASIEVFDEYGSRDLFGDLTGVVVADDTMLWARYQVLGPAEPPKRSLWSRLRGGR